jgi:hypothetical protein
MESNWATEHLQIIRTLMERAALYRRALAPIMFLTGSMGLLGALGGWFIPIELPRSFGVYWSGIGLITLALSYVLVRRQALKEAEPFWSPPARRVTLALLPALVGGFLITAAVCFGPGRIRLEESMTIYATSLAAFVWLPAMWMVLYGCAFHAAGFFLPRGMKLFGYLLLLGGCVLFWAGFKHPPTFRTGHALMGTFFGVLHLAYGVYLRFTEQPRRAP